MRAFIALIITMIIISFIGGSGYLILNNHELKKENINYQLEIQALNNEIKYQEDKNNILIRDKARIQQQMTAYKNAYNKQNQQNYRTKITPKKQSKEIEQVYNTYKPKPTYKKRTEYNKHNSVKPTKRYQEFSKYIELVSDSEISKMNDNRLRSNQKINGRYKPTSSYLSIYNVNCNQKERMLGIRNECSMKISPAMDLVYLSEMEARSIKEFDYKTHMIECKYSKQYGIMHDCKPKLLS